jgi:eukaryotic translation initiation factor 2C
MKRFRIQGKGLFISLVILPGGGEASVYNLVKKCGDVNQIITQCVKREKASKTNVPYFANLMLKINAKLGGLTHKLVSRERSTSLMVRSSIFQDPPASLCWILDEPTMLVGIDLSHPEPGQRDGKSIAAVV